MWLNLRLHGRGDFGALYNSQPIMAKTNNTTEYKICSFISSTERPDQLQALQAVPLDQ